MLNVRGAREHNLKNLTLSVPKFEITVFTGVSGSGKSSLAFDTIFAEGQRRYLDCLSGPARALMKALPRPDVDLVEGLSPVLAVGQSEQPLGARATVGTFTDLYDLLAILFAELGQAHDPETGEQLKSYTPAEMVEALIGRLEEGERLILLAPLGESVPLEQLVKMGYTRVRVEGEDWDLSEGMPDHRPDLVVIDRLVWKGEARQRLTDSVKLALELGRGNLIAEIGEVQVSYSESAAKGGLAPSDFNFNSSRGACPTCGGEGGQLALTALTLSGERSTGEQVHELLGRIERKQKNLQAAAWEALDSDSIQEAIHGSPTTLEVTTTAGTIETEWKGLLTILSDDLARRGSRSRVGNLEGVAWRLCSSCHGGRLKPLSAACQLEGVTLPQLAQMSLENLYVTLQGWTIAMPVALELMPRILSRLECLIELGVGYLTMHRSGSSLSTGEAQRVQLASQIGAQLSGVLYVLDEPSQGLHPCDVQALGAVLTRLRDQGNTLLVVEHDTTLMQSANHLVELGPGAGDQGGEITFEGTYDAMLKSKSLTGEWLRGDLTMPTHPPRKPARHHITMEGASAHNLQNLTVDIPLERFVALCGVSGSGKTTLATECLHPLLKNPDHRISGELERIERTILVDQPSTSSSSRAMPATYIGLMSPLRRLFSSTPLARARGYSPAHFSLSRKGGRCETCEGLGATRVQLDLFPDVWATCTTCQGKRYDYETLQVTWDGHSLADILEMPVSDAFRLFSAVPDIRDKLALMDELGLDYLKLGQPFNALSGGERQRLKLVAELAKRTHVPTLYILDEPATGLHLHDVERLIAILHRLVDQGHSLIVIEHHLEILRQADWIIELGPGGGEAGGQIVFEGKLDDLRKSGTATGQLI
jgi:excinuclease ABC subunit A